MNVGIDKAGNEIRSRKIDLGSPGIVADPQHPSVFYCEVVVLPRQVNELKISAFRHTVSAGASPRVASIISSLKSSMLLPDIADDCAAPLAVPDKIVVELVLPRPRFG
ncbi:MAG: hypothetical protein METHP_00052 [Methanoregula sp. SKADARSKE-2]|nr:MAG: hypothetical protein METHP_00052 [Methanoregula sp. SKADARSKE-2]